MNLIAAVDECWAIGINNELLYNIPLDKAFFKQKTIEKTVIMGKNTYLSLPNSKPFPNRKNIILSTALQNVGCVCCKSMEEIKSTVKDIDTDEIFIIGGEKVYNEFLPYCEFAYLTKILKKTQLANKFFPNLDSNSHWKLIEKGEVQQYGHILFRICIYHNEKRKDFYEL